MDPDKQSIERIRDIFTEARSISPGKSRTAYLNEACGNDSNLRKQVESLLKACITSEGFLSHDAAGQSLIDSSDLVGITIGHYHLEELLGEGGFGEVYRAEQHAPLRREVALKIVKLGMDSKEVLARFEAERQALARMDHPNIAQVYDAGVADTGRPYFVMELVRGVPFLEYCDQQRLSLTERIQLFRQVCDGVQHAHQKGILHRDLKPSNLLVCEENGKPLPKVIDFGVAKSLEGRLTDQTLITMQEIIMGTPMYMSPEQLSDDAADIDTRTDIYSLGVILYELVAGVTPFYNEQSCPVSISQMRQYLMDRQFPRPSKQLHGAWDKIDVIARDRGLKPPTLEKWLRGDLDWIVMKAVEKERDRRYGDVGAFSEDLEQYLKHKPVSAGPPGIIYRSKKFVRRHRVGMVASASIGMILLIGAWVSSIGFLRAVRETERARLQESRAMTATERAEQQELLAEEASNRANRQKQLAEASQQVATHQSARAENETERAMQKEALAEATFGFLTDELLLRADPAEEPDRDIKLRIVVDQAAERLEDHLADQPVDKALIHQMFGGLYLRLAEYEKARHHADESVHLMLTSLGPEDPRTLSCLHDHAEVMSRQGQYKEAEELFSKVLNARQRILGAEHTETLRSMRGMTVCLYALGMHEKAEENFRNIVEIQAETLGAEHPESLRTLYNLAMVLTDQGVYVKAEEILRSVLHTQIRWNGSNDPDTLRTTRGLCKNLCEQGRFEEAEGIYRTALEQHQQRLGSEHPDTLAFMQDLAKSLCTQGKWDEAEELRRDLVEILYEHSGPDHPYTLQSMGELSVVLARRGKYGEAETINRQLLANRTAILGAHHPETLDAQHALASTLARQEKFEEAEALALVEFRIRAQEQGRKHPDTLNAMELLAGIMQDRGKYRLAEQYYRRAVHIRAEVMGGEHPDTLAVQYRLALTLINQESYTEAEQLLRQILEVQQRVLGDTHPQTLRSMGAIASVLRARNREQAADQLEQQILAFHKQNRKPSIKTNEQE